jgi:hypothetical protein
MSNKYDSELEKCWRKLVGPNFKLFPGIYLEALREDSRYCCQVSNQAHPEWCQKPTFSVLSLEYGFILSFQPSTIDISDSKLLSIMLLLCNGRIISCLLVWLREREKLNPENIFQELKAFSHCFCYVLRLQELPLSYALFYLRVINGFVFRGLRVSRSSLYMWRMVCHV